MRNLRFRERKKLFWATQLINGGAEFQSQIHPNASRSLHAEPQGDGAIENHGLGGDMSKSWWSNAGQL